MNQTSKFLNWSSSTNFPTLYYRVIEIHSVAGRILKHTKAKFRQDCKNMVKDLCLQSFIVIGLLYFTENDDLDGKPPFCRLQKPYDSGHIVMNTRME